jgi:hypothetical protein
MAMSMEVMDSLDPESLDNNYHRHYHPKDEKGKEKMVKRI